MSATDTKKLVEDYQNLEKSVAEAKAKIAELESEKAAMVNARNSMVGSDEAKLMRSFGCTSVKELLHKNTMGESFKGVPMEYKFQLQQLKKDVDIARFAAQMLYGAPLDRGEMDKAEHVQAVKNILKTPVARSMDLEGRLKAFGTGSAGAGLEWIETAVSSQYIEEYLLEMKLPQMFQEIPMPTNPFKLPVQTNGAVAKIVAEGAAASDGTFGTDAITFDANYKFVELYNIPEELNEDSAIAILSVARNQLMSAQVKAIETAILNGDTTGTHMDSDVVSASDARKAWKGLRKLALANSANGSVVSFGSAVTKTKLDEMIAAAGKFGINPREAMFIMGSTSYNQAVALDEVTSVDKFGPMATILTGMLAAFRGRGIAVSEYIREDLNVAGVYDGVTVNNTTILLVNKTRFYLGRRRPIRMRAALDSRAEYDRWQLVSYQRADYQGHVQSAAETSVIVGVDVTA